MIEGSTIGTYRVVRQLGEGGMGVVYLAEHTLLGRKAAIKVLLPELSNNKEIVQRFFNEARAVTQIADPGIVQVFDFGFDTSGNAYIVMELLEGEAMDQRLQRIGRFSAYDAVRMMRMIATSLHAAHAKGVIHRDLKPENIFLVGDPAVTGGERAKILDFGIAKLADNEPGRMKTRTGLVMGTPVYMSPEQCRGIGNVDHRSDVYTLGCVMMTMLTGQPPFDGGGSGELIVAHMREQPPRASSRIPDLPPVIDGIIDRCLAKDPAQRFQTAGELALALAQVEQVTFGAPAPSTGPRGYVPVPTPSGALAGYVPAGPTPMYRASAPNQPTTMSNTAGQISAPRRSRSIAIGGTALAVIAIGVAAIVLSTRGGAPASESTTQPAPRADAAPAPPTHVVAADAPAAPVAVVADAPLPDAPAAVATAPDAGVKHASKPPKHAGGDHGRPPPTEGSDAPVDRGD